MTRRIGQYRCLSCGNVWCEFSEPPCVPCPVQEWMPGVQCPGCQHLYCSWTNYREEDYRAA